MMTGVLIFLTLLGCDDAVLTCDVLAQPTPAYHSRAACQEAAEALLDRSLDLPYPTLVTQCATADETVAYLGTVAPPEQVATASRRLQFVPSR